MLLLTACAAVWCGVGIASREVANLNMQLMQMGSLSRELLVKDRTRLTVVRQEDTFYDENVWQVFVPKEGMKIHLTTSGIDGQLFPPKLPHSETSGDLHPGQHSLELKVEAIEDGWHVSVLVDMEPLLELTKDKAWNPDQGSSGGSLVESQLDFSDDKPTIIFKRLFMRDENTNGRRLADPDGNGVVVWIE